MPKANIGLLALVLGYAVFGGSEGALAQNIFGFEGHPYPYRYAVKRRHVPQCFVTVRYDTPFGVDYRRIFVCGPPGPEVQPNTGLLLHVPNL